MSNGLRLRRNCCAATAPRGFTLLEVIVALVILSTAGLVLFGWINQNLATATRLRESQARSQLQIEGVSWLATINPVAEPEGDREMGGLRLTWRATLLEPMRPEFDMGGVIVSRWMIGLYRVNASITRLDSGMRTDWEQVATGWRSAFAAPAANPKTGPP
ncbi:type II secretion system protein [Roseateles sp. P5_E4]